METLSEKAAGIAYPAATEDQVRAFHADGFLVVADVVPLADIDRLRTGAEHLVRNREDLANDWDWRVGEPRDARSFRIVQCGYTNHFPWVAESPLRQWMTSFAARLMGLD